MAIFKPSVAFRTPVVTTWMAASNIDLYFSSGQYRDSSIGITDPNYANTVLMLHGDGVDGSTSISDSTGRHFVTSYVGGTPVTIDTAQSKFGGASISVDYGSLKHIETTSADFTFGTGDFTIDCWFRLSAQTSVGGSHLVGVDGDVLIIYTPGSALSLYNGLIVGTTVIALNTWYHFALTRSGNDHRLFLNGAQEGSTYTAANNYTNNNFVIGRYVEGWMDEVRVVKGVAAWTANFTPPSAPYDVGIGPYDALSCSRASIGYAQTVAGTLTQFAANQLRITDKALLIEGARTNIIISSADLSNVTYWFTGQANVTTDQAVAPDGATAMDKLDDGVASNRHIVYQKPSGYTAGANSTFSVFLKDVDRRYVQLSLSGDSGGFVYCYVDLQTGTITDSGITSAVAGTAFTAATIEAYASGVYRVSLTGIINNVDTGVYNLIALSDRSTHTGLISLGSPSYTGTSKAVYAWGAQSEIAAFASSYIPTTSAAATRAADVITSAGALSSVLQGVAASAYCDLTQPAELFNSPRIIGAATGADTPLYQNNNISVAGFDLSPGVNMSTPLGNSLMFTTGVKVASGWNGSGRSLVGGGGTVATDSNVYDDLDTGDPGIGNGAAANIIFGYFRRITAWNQRLSDQVLRGLTSP